MKGKFDLEGWIVDVVRKRIFQGRIYVVGGKIEKVLETPVSTRHYILPGFIDAHIHIESSMLIPSEFARLAVPHGTVATVSDPHEIANVLGVEGVKFMIRNGKKTPFKFFFGAPSCVPATGFETAGAFLGLEETEELLKLDDIHFLSEMMNYPGVLTADPVVMAKLDLAKKYNKPIDGHAPGLRGMDALKYIRAGISTDHECFSLEEAQEKARNGMHILIREGSAAKNFDTLIPLLNDYPDQVMFCSDDRHPNDLISGHINEQVKRALGRGYDLFAVLRCCTWNPIRHYRLPVGLLQHGDPADMIIVSDLENLEVMATYINGEKVAEMGQTFIQSVPEAPPNLFNALPVTSHDLMVAAEGTRIRVLDALDGQLITETSVADAKIIGSAIVADPGRDLLKLVVMNRYRPSPPAVGFVRNFGLKRGAIASTVAHDSHNIIAVGTNDDDLSDAINLLVETRGGVSLSDGSVKHILPLPVAGIMSNGDGYETATGYDMLDKQAKQLGSTLQAPYMTLSFMALLVIPQLKLSDQGLFDGSTFHFTQLFVK
ncbi:MAG: adenine deaminase [Bacteroidales bacterium]|nr:adenine deaminase [Lentimicrobiaceae bacterium]MDD5694854.1 adenine deaminase [Bacteroidales bacterium]